MKWTLILQLSFVGLALALGSIFFISPNVEPLLWLAVFLYYAHALGNGTRKLLFVQGLMLGILNSVWVVGVHAAFLTRYLSGHPREVSMLDMVRAAKIPADPRIIMAFTGITVGVLEGIVIGVFAMIAGMMVKPQHIRFVPNEPTAGA